VSPAWQPDLGPLAFLVGLAAQDAQPQPAGRQGDILDLPTSSERRSAPAKPNSSSARSRRPRALVSQVASSRRCIGRVRAAALRTGRQARSQKQ
jgi:hypothetical protein